MEVISKEKDKCEELIVDWFKDIFNILDTEKINSVIIYTNSGQIYEISFTD